MACVSWVPISYIFLRGQGIKIASIITKVCSEEKTRIPTLKGFTEGQMDDGFEGAIVLEPKPGIYSDDPVSVLDYASLYPSSIIEKNLSHETFIGTEEDIKNNPILEEVIQSIGGYDKCWAIEYDDYIYEKRGKTTHKQKANTKTKCYFLKNRRTEDGKIIKESLAIIPKVLQTFLDARKSTRKKIKLTTDENKKKVLDGFQLAYKVTANSVYGQMGAKTSSVFFKKIAACTTAIGRERIDDASIGVKRWAKENGYYEPEIVYGDTDSVFVKFSRKDKDTGKILEGKEALRYCIDCGVKAGEWVTENMLHDPQDLEYEKTFYPFILISKKRYTGDKYELDHIKPKERTSMGIVMKRRDNAPICKYVFGNVIEIIMNKRSIDLAIQWLEKTLKDIKEGKMDRSLFVISKSLRGFYKNPEGVAHKVLADRMAERNPGNKPKPNDRIPYSYIELSKSELYDFNNLYKSGPKKGKPKPKKILQGNRIEHPDYIKEKGLNLDYGFYISNQIMNPVKQVLDLEKDEEETKLFFSKFID
jgi:DNA polymerase elongation subunit (family B)